MTAWYLPTPTRWILCEIVTDMFGVVTVDLLSNDAVKDFGQRIKNLRKRPISGAWICERM